MSEKPSSQVGTPPESHQYGACLAILLGSDADLQLGEAGAKGVLTDGTSVGIRRGRQSTREAAAHQTRVILRLEAFAKAAEAEAVGNRVGLALLWAAVSKNITVRVEHTGPMLATVYDRNAGAGLSVYGEGRVSWRLDPEQIFELVRQGVDSGVEPAPELVTSLELFASARLEATLVARFIMLITSLEALSQQRDNGAGVDGLVGEFVSSVREAAIFQGNSPLRDSLIGRLVELRRESVRQAILRTVREYLADDRAATLVDDAYGKRSAILHRGESISGLADTANELEDVLRRIFASIFNLDPQTPLRRTSASGPRAPLALRNRSQ